MVKISATLSDLSTVVFIAEKNEVEKIVNEMFEQGALTVSTTDI